MRVAPETPDERERLAKLESLNVLDTLPEQVYDDIVHLASTICDTPIALVSLIDKDRQWFKAKVGLPASETPRSMAFCSHAIHGNEIFEIADSREDERFHDNPLVTDEPNVIFYAGSPITTSEGYNLGTLCVIDDKPRELDQKQRNMLSRLSRQVAHILEQRNLSASLHKVNGELEEALTRNIELEHTGRRMLDSMLCGVCVYDIQQDRYVYGNPQADQILGFTSEDWNLIPGDFFAKIHTDDILAFRECNKRLKQTEPGEIQEIDFRIRHADGAWRRLHLWESIFELDTQGIPQLLLGCFVDITERKLMEEKLARQNEELKQFTNIASHDLQAPLRHVSVFAEIIRNDVISGEFSESTMKAMDHIQRSTRKMNKLIEDLLAFSRAGEITGSFEEHSMASIVSDVISVLQPTLAQTNAEISVNPLPAIICDRSRIDQLWMNLIGNGLKYVEIVMLAPQITISAEESDEFWLFSVTDNGIGIPQDYQDMVFEPFKRFHENGQYNGSGIGLAICKKVAQLHSGADSGRHLKRGGDQRSVSPFRSSFN